jgi:prepilin-type N-terminal cleavage/methylation domain-containing protein
MKMTPLLESQPSARPARTGGFTLIELLTVISIIGILAGLLVGLAPAAGAKMKEARVRSELAQLVTAIEQYKSKQGFYPPDSIDAKTGLVDPVINPLYYELGGTLVIDPYDASNGLFHPLNGSDNLKPADVKKFFNRDGFANAGTLTNRLYHTGFKPAQHGRIATVGQRRVEVLVVGVPWPPNAPTNALKGRVNIEQTPGVLMLNPWRYVSSKPVHNPDSYDLWAEVIIRGQPRIIGNWKE